MKNVYECLIKKKSLLGEPILLILFTNSKNQSIRKQYNKSTIVKPYKTNWENKYNFKREQVYRRKTVNRKRRKEHKSTIEQ